MKRNLNSQFTILLITSLLITWPLFLPGYFFHHDDLHLMRIFEMRKCFEDFQIPCRWVPDMGYGYGFPLYNYYSTFPYYIGGLASYVLGYISASKLLFFLPLLLGGIFMFLLGKELFGRKAGLVAAILYQFAPYRALDAYVRGAIAESFAMAIIPLVFYFLLKLIKKNSLKNLFGLSLSLGAFLLSHNIMSMFFAPILFIWGGFWWLKEKPKHFFSIFTSVLLGFGLSAFFVIPAFFETNLVTAETLKGGGFDFWIHFTTLKQLFLERSWGFGASVFSTGDTISFQIGWPHWWIVVVASGILLGTIPVIKNFFETTLLDLKSIKLKKNLLAFLVIIFLFSVFMTHNKSTLVWQNFVLLQYAQFPWRYLAVSIFSSSLIGGLLVTIFNQKIQQKLVVVIILLAISLNWGYFIPSDFYLDHTDDLKLKGDYFQFQQKATITDYLPKTAKVPDKISDGKIKIVTGKGQISDFENRSNGWEMKAIIEEDSKIEVPVFDFPNWKVFVNDNQIYHTNSNELGLISFNLEPGQYQIVGRFMDTPIRQASNLLTLFSIGSLFLIIFKKKLNFLISGR